MKPTVIGLIGTIGSGKDEVAKYIVDKHGFQQITMGDLIREETSKRGLELNRENLQATSADVTDKQGMKYWGDMVVLKVKKSGWQKVLINGVRRVPELEVYKKGFGKKFNLILVDADPKIRFDRLKGRKRTGDPKSLEEFKKQERGEIKLYGTFDECVKLADFTVKNESTFEELYKNTDKVMEKIL